MRKKKKGQTDGCLITIFVVLVVVILIIGIAFLHGFGLLPSRNNNGNEKQEPIESISTEIDTPETPELLPSSYSDTDEQVDDSQGSILENNDIETVERVSLNGLVCHVDADNNEISVYIIPMDDESSNSSEEYDGITIGDDVIFKHIADVTILLGNDGEPITFEQLRLGDIVELTVELIGEVSSEINEPPTRQQLERRLTKLQISPNAWEYEGTIFAIQYSENTVDITLNEIALGNRDLNQRTIISHNGVPLVINSIYASDEILLRGVGNTIWFIDVISPREMSSTGTLQFINSEQIVNGMAYIFPSFAFDYQQDIELHMEELNRDVVHIVLPIGDGVPITEQRIDLAEGYYWVAIVGSNIETDFRSPEVQHDEIFSVDLSSIRATMAKLVIKIDTATTNSILVLIDGEERPDALERPIYIPFGSHNIEVRFNGSSIYKENKEIEEDVEINIKIPQKRAIPREVIFAAVIVAVIVTVVIIGFRYNKKHNDVKIDDFPSVLNTAYSTYDPNSLITANDIRNPRKKIYLNVPAMSFSVSTKDIIYIVGASGSGKSTLLKMLAGYDKYDNKHGYLVFADGKTWEKNDSDLKKSIGYVPQADYLYKDVTPYRLLKSYSYQFSLERHIRQKKIEDIFNTLGLDENLYRYRKISDLSGGERKRVSIAVELLREPDILMLDEPDSGLDPESRVGLYKLFDEMNRTGGKTIVFTTHYQKAIRDAVPQGVEPLTDVITYSSFNDTGKYVSIYRESTEEVVERVNNDTFKN